MIRCASHQWPAMAAKRLVILTLGSCAFLLFSPPAGWAQKAAAPEIPKVVSLQKAVEIALERQPTLQASRYSVEASRARVGQARAGFFPQIGITSNYTRSEYYLVDGNKATSGNVVGPSNSYGANVNLNQTLLDFGQTSARTEVARDNLLSSQESLLSTRDQIILNVRQAYYTVLADKRLVTANEGNVNQFKQQLDEATSRYQVGVSTRFDVTSAEVNLSNAQLQLIQARNNLELARVNLNNAMGIPNDSTFGLVDNLAFSPVTYNLPDLLREAEQNRPDLKALEAQRQSAEASVKVARRSFYPTLSGNAGYDFAGREFPLNHQWSVGAVLTFNLFNGFQTREQVAEARANVENLRSQEDGLRQSIDRDVRQAFLNLQQARDQERVNEILVRQAQENLALAQGRYQAGVGILLDETTARVALTNAQTSYVQSLYNYRTAQATLEKAVGIVSLP